MLTDKMMNLKAMAMLRQVVATRERFQHVMLSDLNVALDEVQMDSEFMNTEDLRCQKMIDYVLDIVRQMQDERAQGLMGDANGKYKIGT